MTRLLTVTALALVLGGCSTSYYFVKLSVSDQQRAQDTYECKQATQRSYIAGGGGMIAGGSETNHELLHDCMRARGYIVLNEEERNQRIAALEGLQKEEGLFNEQRNKLLEEQKQVAQLPVLDARRQRYEKAVADFNKRFADFGKRKADTLNQVYK